MKLNKLERILATGALAGSLVSANADTLRIDNSGDSGLNVTGSTMRIQFISDGIKDADSNDAAYDDSGNPSDKFTFIYSTPLNPPYENFPLDWDARNDGSNLSEDAQEPILTFIGVNNKTAGSLSYNPLKFHFTKEDAFDPNYKLMGMLTATNTPYLSGLTNGQTGYTNILSIDDLISTNNGNISFPIGITNAPNGYTDVGNLYIARWPKNAQITNYNFKPSGAGKKLDVSLSVPVGSKVLPLYSTQLLDDFQNIGDVSGRPVNVPITPYNFGVISGAETNRNHTTNYVNRAGINITNLPTSDVNGFFNFRIDNLPAAN